MMTYYDELGVPAEASPEEIREAHYRLVRLLLPERSGDAAARLLADMQIRRLNGILDVLSHPGERADYDRSLVARELVASRPARNAAGRETDTHTEAPDSGRWWYGSREMRRTLATGSTSGDLPSRGEWRAVERALRSAKAASGAARNPQSNWRGWRLTAQWRRIALLFSAAMLAGVVGFLILRHSAEGPEHRTGNPDHAGHSEIGQTRGQHREDLPAALPGGRHWSQQKTCESWDYCRLLHGGV
jgi:hypothetical protein